MNEEGCARSLCWVNTKFGQFKAEIILEANIDDEDYVIFETLMGDDVEKRRDFIVSSANAVENVDV